ncbi:hypothetical protein SLEP1_g55004 [Rubroshorea leprosula]|uniref:Disease resistance N-terminal domain-containing protein n=1 Tax=Rubroshorea leprosula TaxID=152421 RepID=A0AAV5MI79_9ROSI|nr:hypothetical protein SLEP1_g55004 [Rubroshorea leprosula]
MEILSLIGGSLLSVTFELLLKKLDGYLSDRLRSSEKEVCAQMESWKTFLPKIIAILQHAEENPVANEFTKLYLNDLRNLAYDMEDLLEEFVIDDAKRSNSTAHSKASTSKGQKVKSILKNPFKSKAKLNRETISMVEHLNVRLKPIKEAMDTLGLFQLTMKVDDNSCKVAAKRPLESTVLEDYVCGRNSDKKAILDWLLDDGLISSKFLHPPSALSVAKRYFSS